MKTRRRLALLLAASAAAAPLARADVKKWFYVNDLLFEYEVAHMPDLDQRRANASGIFGLPGNGSMYCVPTASMNLLAYAANHGFPEVDPGQGNWQAAAKYNEATLWLLIMGQNMGTSATGGTGGQGWYDGVYYWLQSNGKFTVSQYTAHDNYAPTVTKLAKSALNGSILAFAYGRYDVVDHWGEIPVIDRDGGHAVTFAKASRTGSLQTLASRDPAAPNDGQHWSQATFGNTPYAVTQLAVTTNGGFGGLKSMSALNYVAGEKLRLIDQYVAIRPKFCWTWQSSGPDFVLHLHQPLLFSGSGLKETITLPGDGSVFEAVIDPDQNGFVALVAKGGKPDAAVLRSVDLLSGKATDLMPLPGMATLAFGRSRELYALGGKTLQMLDLDASEPKPVARTLPVPGDALAVDDLGGDVVVLSLAARKLLRLPVGLQGEWETVEVPASVPLGLEGSLAIDPRTGIVWLTSDKGDGLYGLRIADGKVDVIPVLLPAVKAPTSIDVDDAGHLFVAAQGKILELAETAAGFEVVDSPFAKFAAGPTVHVSRSRTNFDPKTMSGPKWRHLDEKDLAEFGDVEIPDCESAAADVEYCAGKPGAFGVPRLSGTGTPALGAAAGLAITNGRPGAQPILLFGLQQLAAPFDGGTLLVSPAFVLPLPLAFDANGKLEFGGTVPADAGLCGLTLYHQALFADPGASGYYGVALTNGLARTFGG